MARLPSTIFLSLFLAKVYASYDQFYFATNATEYKCPLSAFQCIAPQACVHETLLDKWYCCAPGADAVCWAPDLGCDGTAGSSEIACGDSSYTFCCLKGREECTQRTNQINICWALPDNLLANSTDAKMNETYSSLSSAAPEATSLVFELAQLFPSLSSVIQTSTSPVITTATTSNTASPASATSAPTSPVPSSSSGLSSGATAGIVIGVVALVAAIGAAVFFFCRRKRGHGAELDSNPYVNGGYGAMAGAVQQEKYRHELAQPPVELDARNPVAEMGSEGKWRGLRILDRRCGECG